MTPLIKMLFSQISLCFHISYSLLLDKVQTQVSASSFVICIHQNNAVYVYIPLASSVLPLNASQSVYIIEGFGNNPKIISLHQ